MVIIHYAYNIPLMNSDHSWTFMIMNDDYDFVDFQYFDCFCDDHDDGDEWWIMNHERWIMNNNE